MAKVLTQIPACISDSFSGLSRPLGRSRSRPGAAPYVTGTVRDETAETGVYHETIRGEKMTSAT